MSDLENVYARNKENFQAMSQPDAATDKVIDSLMAEARNFHNSKHETRKKLLKVSWCVAGGLGVVCLAQAIALAVLMPLKQTEPLMITMFKDGTADIVRDFSQPIIFEEAVDEKFLREYVTNRETYDWYKLQYLVDFTKAWSADHVFREYYSYTTMPNSFFELLKDTARVDATITAVDMKKESGMATIRLTQTPKKADGAPIEGIEPTYWVVELKYEQGFNQKSKDKEFNPFGYKILSYTRTQDRTKG